MSNTLIDLLKRHHAMGMAQDVLNPDEEHYAGTALYHATAAAITEAKSRDPLRTRVPVWRCPVCEMKFNSNEKLVAHRADWNHGTK